MYKRRNLLEVILEKTRSYSGGFLESLNTKNQRREKVCHLAVFASPATSSAMRHPPDQSTAQTSSNVCSLLTLFVAGVLVSAKSPPSHVELSSSKSSSFRRGHFILENGYKGWDNTLRVKTKEISELLMKH